MTRNRWQSIVALILVALWLPTTSLAQAPTPHPVGRNLSELAFGGVPNMPTCTTGAIQSGDPRTGPAIIIGRLEPGCIVPWHWHTQNEHLMLIEGEARVETRDGPGLTLKPGGFARLPSRHVHQFSCPVGCLLFVYSDSAFDIQYVDTAGRDLSPDEALRAVGQAPFRPPA